jgi:DNA-binding beta-propeller fold protein YncE
MNTLKILILILSVFLISSCKKSGSDIDTDSIEASLKGDGVFIINEGNFMAGNGSLSFYSYSSGKIFNNVFSIANGRPLGDVPNSMTISGNYGYIIVNNTGTIEVVDKNNLQSAKTIMGLNSPRNMLIVNSEKAYVSSLYSNNLAIINLPDNKVSGSISIRRSSEAMVLSGNKAFISSWYQGKEIIVVNTLTDKTIDSIKVAPEPESMVIDKNNKLWVLCSGGYTGQVHAELIKINPATDAIEQEFIFPTKLSYPSCLQINKTRDTLYYIDNGLWRMSIQSTVLPTASFKQPVNRLLYKLGVDPRYGRIFYTDALDYQQKGYVLQLNPQGRQIDSCRADIIPANFCFK